MATDVKPKSLEEQISELHLLIECLHDEQKDQRASLKNIRHAFETDLAQEQQVNAALLGWFKQFRAQTCKAAWAVAMPGSEVGNLTAFVRVRPGCKGRDRTGHTHAILTPEQRQVLAELAALDPSGYAPGSGGSAAEGCLMRPAGPAEHPGAMHRGIRGLPFRGAKQS